MVGSYLGCFYGRFLYEKLAVMGEWKVERGFFHKMST